MKPWKVVIVIMLVDLVLSGTITNTNDAYVYQTPPQIYRWLEEAETPTLDMLSLLQPYEITPPSDISPRLPVPSKDLNIAAGTRMIVFTPHPDDETLAAGGLIQRVLANDGKVCVVFITNGDGFVEGVRRAVKRNQTSAGDFIEYGNRRHTEALQAMSELGLESEDVIFLGFPDDGIDDLWSSYWSARKPYQSPHTRFNQPAYAESYNRWVKYAGIDLKDEIVGIMDRFLPDLVVVPDPRDIHPDHCTTAVFVLDALARLLQEQESHFLHTQVLTYLVHYMDYPVASTWTKEFKKVGIGGTSTAGGVLSSVEWLSISLSPEEQLAKQRALSAHQTQLLVMGSFLRQFLRPNELFCRLQPAQVLAVPREWSARFSRKSDLALQVR